MTGGPEGGSGTLLVTAGQDHGARLVVQRPVVEIGRGPSADLMLTDATAAPRHLRLRRRAAGGLVAEDLGGGVRVNGRPLAYPLPVRAGDVITLGATELTLLTRLPAAVAPAPARPVPVLATAPARPAPQADAGARAAVPVPGLGRTGLGLAALLLATVLLTAPFVPVGEVAAGLVERTRTLDSTALVTQAALTGWIAVAAAVVALLAVRPGAGAPVRATAPPLLAVAGGLAAGLPLSLVTWPDGDRVLPGVVVLLGAALALAACGPATVVIGAPRGVMRPASAPGLATCLAAAAVLVVCAPLPWAEVPFSGDPLRGTGESIRLGWVAIGLGVALAAAAVATVTSAARDGRAAAAWACAGLGVAGVAVGFAAAALIRLDEAYAPRAGVAVAAVAAGLALVGTARVAAPLVRAATAGGPGDR